MKKEKKQMMNERQKHIAILRSNRQLLKINVLILSIGLALSYLGHEKIGEPVLWIGIIIFIYTTITNLIARKNLKK
ncbi:hypothetical protein [Methanolobus sp. WCC5]|uniref:hypothetical protein n=1 Tax=Methanolobus sp. WCC5 TaxID=3125785 RepID=UPI00325164B1